MTKQDGFILIWMEDLIIKNKMTRMEGTVVEHLNLRIDSGEYVCISGLYGTDKISFINTLSCLNRPDGGKYIYNYIDTSTIGADKLDALRSKIGFVFKGLNIIESLTVYQNIEIPIHISTESEKKHIDKVAEKLNLSEILHEKAKGLSDFEKHKVALARALAVNPILIIADEPASNLKQQEEEEILDIFQEINSTGTAIIYFSDRKQLIENAKRHIAFENGKILSYGNDINSSKEEGTV